MERHPITWTAPQPLWTEATGADPERTVMSAPAILRFTTDDFMPEFLNVLATDPHRLGEYRVVKETWRGVLTTQTTLAPKKLAALSLQRFAAARLRRNGHAPDQQGRAPSVRNDTESVPLKLYQPAHQRYYLVASCLVCQKAGLPDRKVDPGKQEQSGFVMRRLIQPRIGAGEDPALWPEHAWVVKDGARSWQVLHEPEQGTLFPGEEVLPLFGANHVQDDQHPRRLLAGLIPVGKREVYLAASGGPENSNGGVTEISARKALLRKEVIEPWKGLITRALTTHESLHGGENTFKTAQPNKFNALLLDERQKIQTVSWLVLLDFANYLRRYAPKVWGEIQQPPATGTLSTAEQALLVALQGTKLGVAATGEKFADQLPADKDSALTLANDLPDALRRALAAESKLESADTPFEFAKPPVAWPNFLFPLADPERPDLAAKPDPGILPSPTPDETSELERLADERDDATELLDRLAALVVRALDPERREPEPAVPLAARQPAGALEGWFVIRCVYARPQCGKLHEDVVSAATGHFQLAGFFDPDAPARPIRIGLPIDTTPAGLRKFDRNTAFVISDTLCGQIARMKGLTLGDLVRTVLPWPLHKDLDVPDQGPCKKGAGPDASFGMMCSLSIPIITICALILLMIMVNLLEIVFRWLPYFMVCFPVPGLKAKKT